MGFWLSLSFLLYPRGSCLFDGFAASQGAYNGVVSTIISLRDLSIWRLVRPVWIYQADTHPGVVFSVL